MENLQRLDANRCHEPVEILLNSPSTFAKPTADKSGTFSPLGEKDGMRGFG
jgi:hypothetical protein